MSKDVRVRGYFSKPKGVGEQRRLGNAGLETVITDTYWDCWVG
jgi:hypothetical protein